MVQNPSLKQNVRYYDSNTTKFWVSYNIFRHKNITLYIEDEVQMEFINSVVTLKKINDTSDLFNNYVLNVTKRNFPDFRRKTITGGSQ